MRFINNHRHGDPKLKLPILHTLEKKIRHTRRTKGFDLKNKNYTKVIAPELEPIRIENAQESTLQPKTSKEPLVSIIIPVFNQFEYTRKCLNSIARNTSPNIPYEIILIDDHSSDETIDIEKDYPDITVYRNETNQGFLRNINFAATLAKGKYLHLLNNDTIVAPEWLKSMVDVFNRFKDVGAVGSKLVYPSGILQEAGGYITSDAQFGNYGKNNNFFSPKYNYIREVDYVSGASLLITKKLWTQLNGFDEAYLPAYFEDTDLAMRVRQAGLRVMYQPKSVIFHFESISYSKAKETNKANQMEKNKQLFLSVWETEIKKTHKTRHDGFRFYERNMNKFQTILYIDGEVPNDYSCGAKLSLNYCKLLHEMGYTIKFLPMLTSRTIKEDIIRLGQFGIETITEYDKVGNLIIFNKSQINRFKSWLQANRMNIDHYLLARPSSDPYFQIIRSVAPEASYLYHPADLHFLRHERSKEFKKKESGFRGYRRRRRMEKKKKQELELLKNADKVLHVSVFEQEYLETNYGYKNGVVIPCLFFDKIDEHKIIPKELKDLMFIGGRHSASVDGIHWFLTDIFPIILKESPKTRVHIIGDCGHNITSLENIIVHGRLPEDQMIEFYKKTITILPLRFGAGVKGKTLEAMYYGAPIVSTSIGLEGIPNIKQVMQGHDDAKSFATQVILMLQNPTRANEYIHTCQNIINSHFTKNTAKLTCLDLFK